MLHKFSFGNGQVSYANKFLHNRAYTEAQENGRIAYSEFATDPCRSLFGRVMSVFSPQITDSAKVSLTKIADRFVALAETPIQVQFDPKTLEMAGVLENTIVLLTADLGENLYEHGLGMEHGDHLYGRTTLEVPLVLDFPGNTHRGQWVEAPMSLCDVAPTVLEP